MYCMASKCITCFFSVIGVHVQQKLTGCELIDSNIPGTMQSWDAFNGVTNADWEFNMHQRTLQCDGLWTSVTKQTQEFLYTNVYFPICIKTLKKCLTMRKHEVRRKGKIPCFFV